MAKFTTVVVLLVITLSFGYTQLIKNIPTREPTEKFIEYLLLFASFAAVMTTVGIIFSLLMQTLKFFQVVNLFDFLIIFLKPKYNDPQSAKVQMN